MYRKGKRSWVKHLDFIVLDILCQQLALVIAYYWRFREWLIFGDFWPDNRYRDLAVYILLIDIFVVFFTESYTGILRRNKYQEFRQTIIHCTVILAGITVFNTATKHSELYSRKLIFFYYIVAIILEYIVRVFWKRLIRYQKLKDMNKSIMIVVCENYNIERCLKNISHDRYTDYKVKGAVVVDKNRQGEIIQGIPVIANADNFLDYVRQNVVDEVFIDGNTRNSSEALASELIELGVTVHMSLVYSTDLGPNMMIEHYGEYTVLTSSMKLMNTRQAFIKRFTDIVGALVGIFFTMIAFLIFAPIIKKQSPGPVFYKSTRIGRNGRRFKFYKFRTMYVGADKDKEALMSQNEMKGNMFKMEDDPRIIPIGHFMRKHSIDELPQFFNVLIGDMSLVGTRPPTEDEFQNYEFHHKARLAIKPGLTGMWQVSGRSNINDFEEIVALDTQYIMNWTLGLDAKIIFKTIAVVFTGKGSE